MDVEYTDERSAAQLALKKQETVPLGRFQDGHSILSSFTMAILIKLKQWLQNANAGWISHTHTPHRTMNIPIFQCTGNLLGFQWSVTITLFDFLSISHIFVQLSLYKKKNCIRPIGWCVNSAITQPEDYWSLWVIREEKNCNFGAL